MADWFLVQFFARKEVVIVGNGRCLYGFVIEEGVLLAHILIVLRSQTKLQTWIGIFYR